LLQSSHLYVPILPKPSLHKGPFTFVAAAPAAVVRAQAVAVAVAPGGRACASPPRSRRGNEWRIAPPTRSDDSRFQDTGSTSNQRVPRCQASWLPGLRRAPRPTGAVSTMAQFLGTRCQCGQVAVTQRTIRSYRTAGRLTERETGSLLPRADKAPVGPLCIHHLLQFLEERLGKGIKARFWEDRLRWPRNTSQCRRRPCRGTKSNGAACAASAMRGSVYCQAHQPDRQGSYGLSPWLHGRRCKVVALSTGLPCKRAVMHGYSVCASHGGKAGEASKAIMAAPYDPAAAAARKAKRERHRAYAHLRNSGQAPPPAQESLHHFEQRAAREQRAERRLAVWQGSAMTDGERIFCEGRN
jgi:hypothetical protein